MQELSWTDLPQHNLKEILHDYDAEFSDLNKKVQSYHRIWKNSWSTTYLRINHLDDIYKCALNLSKNIIEKDYLSQAALKISEVARKKIYYLRGLQHLNEGGFQKQKHDIFNANHISSKFIPLILNNIKKYNYKTEEIWGEYLLEAIDPCHRRLMNSYYEIWHLEFSNDYLPDFLLWLEDKNISILHPMIRIFSPPILDKYKIKIKEGKFYCNKDDLISTRKHEFNDPPSKGPCFYKEHIFIIDHREQVYLCYSSHEIAHSSLSHYKPIIGSGKLFLLEGNIKRISFDSGHYLPNKDHCIQTIKLLWRKGVRLDSQIRLDYFNDYKYISTTIGDFFG